MININKKIIFLLSMSCISYGKEFKLDIIKNNFKQISSVLLIIGLPFGIYLYKTKILKKNHNYSEFNEKNSSNEQQQRLNNKESVPVSTSGPQSRSNPVQQSVSKQRSGPYNNLDKQFVSNSESQQKSGNNTTNGQIGNQFNQQQSLFNPGTQSGTATKGSVPGFNSGPKQDSKLIENQNQSESVSGNNTTNGQTVFNPGLNKTSESANNSKSNNNKLVKKNKLPINTLESASELGNHTTEKTVFHLGLHKKSDQKELVSVFNVGPQSDHQKINEMNYMHNDNIINDSYIVYNLKTGTDLIKNENTLKLPKEIQNIFTPEICEQIIELPSDEQKKTKIITTLDNYKNLGYIKEYKENIPDEIFKKLFKDKKTYKMCGIYGLAAIAKNENVYGDNPQLTDEENKFLMETGLLKETNFLTGTDLEKTDIIFIKTAYNLCKTIYEDNDIYQYLIYKNIIQEKNIINIFKNIRDKGLSMEILLLCIQKNNFLSDKIRVLTISNNNFSEIIANVNNDEANINIKYILVLNVEEGHYYLVIVNDKMINNDKMITNLKEFYQTIYTQLQYDQQGNLVEIDSNSKNIIQSI